MSKSFILYKLPDQESIHFSESRAIESYNLEFIKSLKEDYFVVAPFKVDSKTPVFAIPMKEDRILNEDELKELDLPFDERRVFGLNETTEKEYKSKVSIQRCKMETGSYNKLVLSRVKKIKREGQSLQKIFIDLANTYKSAFVYLLQLPNGQVWCGATPETLAKYEKGKLRTMALAGTQVINSGDPKAVEWQKKELDEQKWVQNAIKVSFKKSDVSFSKSKAYTAQAGHLAHIRTDFTAKCNIEAASQIVINLHPTPAVCGTPTDETQSEILKIESHNRLYYSGYLGLYAPQQFNLFVNLRCMLIDKQYFYLFVGGGLTKDSDPEMEWEETEVKAKTLSRIIEGLE